jgi:hypothetical protein
VVRVSHGDRLARFRDCVDHPASGGAWGERAGAASERGRRAGWTNCRRTSCP